MQELRAAESGGPIRQLCTGEHFKIKVVEELVPTRMDGATSHVDTGRPLNRALVLCVSLAQSSN